jgi:hypothetical protein
MAGLIHRFGKNPETEQLSRVPKVVAAGLHLFLPSYLYELEYAKLLFCDVGERYRQTDAPRIQYAEAPPHERAVRRIHRLFEEILGAARPVADVDGLPICAANGAAIQFRLRRVAALPASEDAVGALFFGSAQPDLAQHRPD